MTIHIGIFGLIFILIIAGLFITWLVKCTVSAAKKVNAWRHRGLGGLSRKY